MSRFANPNSRSRPIVVAKSPSIPVQKEVGHRYPRGHSLPGASLKGKHVIEVRIDGVRYHSPVNEAIVLEREVRSQERSSLLSSASNSHSRSFRGRSPGRSGEDSNNSSTSPTTLSRTLSRSNNSYLSLPLPSQRPYIPPTRKDRTYQRKGPVPSTNNTYSLSVQQGQQQGSHLGQQRSLTPTQRLVSVSSATDLFSSNASYGGTAVSGPGGIGGLKRSNSVSSMRSFASSSSVSSMSLNTSSITPSAFFRQNKPENKHLNSPYASPHLTQHRSVHKDEIIYGLAAGSSLLAGGMTGSLDAAESSHGNTIDPMHHLQISQGAYRSFRKAMVREAITTFLQEEVNSQRGGSSSVTAGAMDDEGSNSSRGGGGGSRMRSVSPAVSTAKVNQLHQPSTARPGPAAGQLPAARRIEDKRYHHRLQLFASLTKVIEEEYTPSTFYSNQQPSSSGSYQTQPQQPSAAVSQPDSRLPAIHQLYFPSQHLQSAIVYATRSDLLIIVQEYHALFLQSGLTALDAYYASYQEQMARRQKLQKKLEKLLVYKYGVPAANNNASNGSNSKKGLKRKQMQTMQHLQEMIQLAASTSGGQQEDDFRQLVQQIIDSQEYSPALLQKVGLLPATATTTATTMNSNSPFATMALGGSGGGPIAAAASPDSISPWLTAYQQQQQQYYDQQEVAEDGHQQHQQILQASSFFQDMRSRRQGGQGSQQREASKHPQQNSSSYNGSRREVGSERQQETEGSYDNDQPRQHHSRGRSRSRSRTRTRSTSRSTSPGSHGIGGGATVGGLLADSTTAAATVPVPVPSSNNSVTSQGSSRSKGRFSYPTLQHHNMMIGAAAAGAGAGLASHGNVSSHGGKKMVFVEMSKLHTNHSNNNNNNNNNNNKLKKSKPSTLTVHTQLLAPLQQADEAEYQPGVVPSPRPFPLPHPPSAAPVSTTPMPPPSAAARPVTAADGQAAVEVSVAAASSSFSLPPLNRTPSNSLMLSTMSNYRQALEIMSPAATTEALAVNYDIIRALASNSREVDNATRGTGTSSSSSSRSPSNRSPSQRTSAATVSVVGASRVAIEEEDRGDSGRPASIASPLRSPMPSSATGSASAAAGYGQHSFHRDDHYGQQQPRQRVEGGGYNLHHHSNNPLPAPPSPPAPLPPSPIPYHHIAASVPHPPPPAAKATAAAAAAAAAAASNTAANAAANIVAIITTSRPFSNHTSFNDANQVEEEDEVQVIVDLHDLAVTPMAKLSEVGINQNNKNKFTADVDETKQQQANSIVQLSSPPPPPPPTAAHPPAHPPLAVAAESAEGGGTQPVMSPPSKDAMSQSSSGDNTSNNTSTNNNQSNNSSTNSQQATRDKLRARYAEIAKKKQQQKK